MVSKIGQRKRNKIRIQLIAEGNLPDLDYECLNMDRVFGWSEAERKFIYYQHGFPVERFQSARIERIEQIMMYSNEHGQPPGSKPDYGENVPLSALPEEYELIEAEFRFYETGSGLEFARIFFDTEGSADECIGVIHRQQPAIEVVRFEVAD